MAYQVSDSLKKKQTNKTYAYFNLNIFKQKTVR